MSEEIDKHVLRKYEIVQRLGKYVSLAAQPPLYYLKGSIWNRMESSRKKE